MLIAPLQHAQAKAAVDLWRAAGLTRPWNGPDEDLERALAGPASTVLAGMADVVVLSRRLEGARAR